MDGWDSLKRQLNRFAEKGLVASFWWRDDDACELTPALERLVKLACDTHTPLAIAVIPEGLSPDLPKYLAGAGPQVKVLQHGFSHKNHAANGHKKQELTVAAGLDFLCNQLSEGRIRLAEVFADTFLPVLVNETT